MSRLLLIDDDTGTLEWMRPMLASAGHEVRSVPGAHDALQVLTEWTPDLVVADILLPDVAGPVYARLVRVHRLPVLFVSVMRGEAQAVLRGASGLVRKPVTPGSLRSAVGQVLSKRAGERNLVLLADDDADVRSAFRFMLEPDVEVVEASDGVEAIECLQRLPVRAVVTDIHMPRMNGVDLVRWLRADPRFQTLPVLVVSSDQVLSQAPVWTELAVERSMSKVEFADWLLARIDEHLGATRPGIHP